MLNVLEITRNALNRTLILLPDTRRAFLIRITAVIALTVLAGGCATTTIVTHAYPCGDKPSREEAMRILAQSSCYDCNVVDETGIEGYITIPEHQYIGRWAGANSAKWNEVTKIEIEVSAAGGCYFLYRIGDDPCYTSGINHPLRNPAYMNRVLAALLLLCPNVH